MCNDYDYEKKERDFDMYKTLRRFFRSSCYLAHVFNARLPFVFYGCRARSRFCDVSSFSIVCSFS
jgi:hypothetical protein